MKLLASSPLQFIFTVDPPTWLTCRVCRERPDTLKLQEISSHEVADPHPTPEQSYFDQLAVENITRAVQHLPAYLRPSMQLHIQGYSYEQMASTLGVSVGTVKSRIFRARSLLRERLMQ